VPPQHVGVFERWWEEHSELDQLVQGLREALESGSRFRASEALEDLGVALDSHLAIEEDVYFPLLQQLVPETASGIQAALEAHVEIRAELDRMRSELTRLDLPTVEAALDRLLRRFEEHERQESRMIAPLRARP
jgi:iron-sulfur cluster repair protein YtfE (RIC family)